MSDRILAVDYGEKRIGLAVSDPLGIAAHSLPYILNHGISGFIREIKKVIEEKSVSFVVVGLPRSLDGHLGPKAVECQKIAERIRHECHIRVELYDESFTTKEAEEFLIGQLDLSRKKRKEIKDSLSASLLLRSYMSAKKG